MKKYYEELQAEVVFWSEDTICASTEKDPFDDGYQDPNFS